MDFYEININREIKNRLKREKILLFGGWQTWILKEIWRQSL